MTGESIIDTLRDSGVFLFDGEGENIGVTDRFEERIETVRSSFERDNDALVDRFTSFGFSEADARWISDAAPDPVLLGAVYDAMTERVPDLDSDHTLLVSAQVVQLLDGQPPIDGAPNAFFPVDADKLALFTGLYERSIVYIWRRDCDPCDVVCADLNALLADPPVDVGLLSVYGPEWTDLLRDDYQVVGGPTVLFMQGTTVESRLIRTPKRSVIEAEIETLRSE